MKGNIILQVLHFINEKLRTKELMKLAQDHTVVKYLKPRSSIPQYGFCSSFSSFHSYLNSKGKERLWRGKIFNFMV